MGTVLITDDGSQTLVSEEFGELYHSRRGAVTESKHVFLQEGFEVAVQEKPSLSIGEIGLGSGLNALLTAYKARETGIRVQYHAIEAFPPPTEVVENLFQADWNPETRWLSQIHGSVEGETMSLHPHFQFTWIKGLWPGINPFHQLDLLYYDAFAPSCQPEMWDHLALLAAWTALKPGGFLVTYCAKGSFKRELKAIGFEVQNPPGAPGKREMTRAVKR